MGIATTVGARSAVVVFVVAAVLAPSAAAPQPLISRDVADRPPGLTWDEAVARGHPAVADFGKPRGVPFCEPSVAKTVGTNEPVANAPACFARPKDQGLVIPEGGPTDGPIAPPDG